MSSLPKPPNELLFELQVNLTKEDYRLYISYAHRGHIVEGTTPWESLTAAEQTRAVLVTERMTKVIGDIDEMCIKSTAWFDRRISTGIFKP